MPRIVEIALSTDKTNQVIADVKTMKGLIGLRVFKGVSMKPEGDLISLEITNEDLSSLMELLSERKLLSDPSVSVTTSFPGSVIAKSREKQITTDKSEAIWEEMQAAINKESAMTINGIITMFLAGVLAVIGIVTNALHIVVGAMVIAPGFEPIARISLGIVSDYTDWKKGVTDSIRAYGALLAGATLGALAMHLLGFDLAPGNSSYLPAGVLVSYWTTINASSIITAVAAAVAGALVIVANRQVLTAGVMIALALVPATAIIGIGLVSGNFTMAADGIMRLLFEFGIVGLGTAAVFSWKMRSGHRRKMYS